MGIWTKPVTPKLPAWRIQWSGDFGLHIERIEGSPLLVRDLALLFTLLAAIIIKFGRSA